MKKLLIIMTMFIGIGYVYGRSTYADKYSVTIVNQTDEVIEVNPLSDDIAYFDEVADNDCYKNYDHCAPYPIFPGKSELFSYRNTLYHGDSRSVGASIKIMNYPHDIGYIQVMYNFPKNGRISSWSQLKVENGTTMPKWGVDLKYDVITDYGFGNIGDDYKVLTLEQNNKTIRDEDVLWDVRITYYITKVTH